MTEPLVLALDTATVVNVGLARGGQVLAAATVADRMVHAEQLMPLVAGMLVRRRRTGRRPGPLVVGLGPGPFTGLRVGVVTAQVLATVAGVGLHGVCSLDVLAAAVRRDRSGGGVRGGHRCPAARGLLGPLRRGRHPRRADRRSTGRTRCRVVPPSGRPWTSTPTSSTACRAAAPGPRRDGDLAGLPCPTPAESRSTCAAPTPPSPAGPSRCCIVPRDAQHPARPAGGPGRDHGAGAGRLRRVRAVERAQLAGRAGRGQPPGADRPGHHDGRGDHLERDR